MALARPKKPVAAVLAVICSASFVVIVVLGSRLTFFNDDWYFLLQRPGLESHGGLDVLLAPHNSNLVVLTAGMYKLLVAVFGLGSQVPYRVVIGLSIVAVGVMVFVLVSRRAGPVVGLACSSVILFLGPAWEDLFFFGAAVDIAGALASGLAALWLLERPEPKTAPACLLLICSVGFSNVGVPFVIGAVVVVLLARRPAELWVAAIPLILFALWWAFYGHREPSHLSLHNAERLPRYVLESISSGLASAAGLSRGGAHATYIQGFVVLGLVSVLLVFALRRGWRPRSSFLVPAAVAVSFWCLTGLSFFPGREPIASRYQLFDAALLILVAADLVGSVRLGRASGALLAVVTVAVVSSNVADRLTYGYRFLREQSRFAKADLGALQIGGKLAPANLWLLDPIAHNPYLSGVTAGRFFAETGAHGAVPVYTPTQIASAPATQREGADNVLALAERINPVKTTATLTQTSGCALLSADATGPTPESTLAPGAWLLTETGGGTAIAVRRFAPPGATAIIGLIAPGITERMVVPRDGLRAAWRLSIRAPTSRRVRLRVCRV